MTSKSLKVRFFDEVAKMTNPVYLIVAIELPTGAIEVITNTSLIGSKANYYLTAYDEEFRLKANPDVKVINYMLLCRS